MEYEIIELEPSGQLIKQTDSNQIISFVPMDEGNTDYQNYLASLNETNKL
jgi:hypothetical protein